MFDDSVLHDLFVVVRLFTLAAGGDGDGWIVSPDFLILSEKFEVDERTNAGDWFTEKNVTDGCISFGHGQEAIFFVGNRKRLPNWVSDIVIEIP